MIRDNFEESRSKFNGSASTMFNLIRALSAIMVLLTHLRGFMFVPYAEVADQNLLLKAFYFITSTGQQAVMVFFVLSGFFISSSVLASHFDNRWSWKGYLINRFSRLYAVLLPALVLTLFLDSLGRWIFGAGLYYGDYAQNNGFIPFIGNVLFLQGISVPVYGTNGPLWSLNYEFWYYIIFPLIFIGILKNTSLKKKIIYLCLSVALLVFIKSISLYFIIWLLGVVILISPAVKFKGIFTKILVSIPIIGIFIISVYFSALIQTGGNFKTGLESFFRFALVALSFTLIMYIILNFSKKYKEVNANNNLKKVAKLFADFSFTLYLVHYPIIAFLMSWYMSRGGGSLQPTIFNLVIFAVASLLVLCLSYGISLLTEAHTNKFRSLLSKLLKKGDMTGALNSTRGTNEIL